MRKLEDTLIKPVDDEVNGGLTELGGPVYFFPAVRLNHEGWLK